MKSIGCCVALLLAMSTYVHGQVSTPNLVENGSFEFGFPGGNDGPCKYVPSGGSTAIAGWTVVGGPFCIDWYDRGCLGINDAPDGDFYLDLKGSYCPSCNNNGGVRQTINVDPGTTYVLSLDLAMTNNPNDSAIVSVNGVEYELFGTGPEMTWETYGIIFQAEEETVDLYIYSPGDHTGVSLPLLDDVWMFNGDCNGDGLIDLEQILNGTLLDENNNYVPDCCDAQDCIWNVDVACYNFDFSSVQGGNGWNYRFDEGSGTPEEDLPNFVEDSWIRNCSTLYCYPKARVGGLHPGIPGNERIIARWTPESTNYYRIILEGDIDACTGGLLIEVLVDGVVVATHEAPEEGIDVAIAVNAVASSDIKVRLDNQGNGHCDQFYVDNFKIFSQDCNDDGIMDYGQILDGTFEDLNLNYVPDCCEGGEPCGSCIGDINEDGIVDAADLGIMLKLWGSDAQGTPRADITGDGVVSGADLGYLLYYWGLCP